MRNVRGFTVPTGSSGSDCMLPARVHTILYDHGGWLVGSGVPWFLGNGPTPKDLDVIVPPENWTRVVRSLPTDFTVNKFGGLVFVDENWSVDIWPTDVGSYFRQGGYKTPRYAMSLNPYVVLERQNA